MGVYDRVSIPSGGVLMDLDLLYRDLERDEGLRLKPYTDTAGKLTIGVGRNLTDNGITAAEAHRLLANDVAHVMNDLDRNAPWWRNLTELQQRALCNMGFNLGWPRLSQFKNMLAALARGDGETASTEALDSTWARQVGERANRIARMLALMLALVLVPGCVELDAARMAAREAAEAINDRTMDDARKVLCNNFYSAEQRFLERTGVPPDAFKGFCGRGDKSVR